MRIIHDICFAGQRKRLALLTAYLEDRPFIFLMNGRRTRIHTLRMYSTRNCCRFESPGKNGAVITHDDKYFDLADRIIKLDYGKLASPVASEPEGQD